MILKLSDLLHYMLYEANRDRVPLEKEIRYLKHYIELETASNTGPKPRKTTRGSTSSLGWKATNWW